MTARTETVQFDEVKRRLRPGDVFHNADHDWKTQGDTRWKGACPWHESDSGTCFAVNPETLEWHCFSCDRGGGPLQYVAEMESIGSGARGALKGQDFFRAWEALARHAGCEGPPDEDSGGDNRTRKSSDRRPSRNSKKRSTANRRARLDTPKATAGAPSASRDIPPRGKQPERDTGRKMKHSEQELRRALKRYRKALKVSDKARAYVEGRGLSVETLRAYGCGYAPPGEWLDDDIKNENGTLLHRAPNGRIVTPHTTPGGRLVCLSGRAVEPCPDWLRKRHLDGHSPALFNAKAIEEEAGPLVICEGPFDALSFIEVGHERAIATHGKHGPPWPTLRGKVETVVFAFDRDDPDAREEATALRREAYWQDYDAHTLHDEDAYSGHGDPNEALQAGELTTGYLRRLAENPMDTGDSRKPHGHPGENGAAEGAVAAGDESGPAADRSPTSRPSGRHGAEDEATPADLVPHWNGSDIGHLGRWLWERGGVPDGNVGAGLYADRELHKWVKEQLEAGPHGTSDETQTRLRWVLWRLYAAHGPEDVPERQIPIPPMRRA